MEIPARRPPLDLREVAKNLVLNEDGIWSSGKSAPVSYPEDGQDRYFAIEDESFWYQHRNNCLAAAMRRFPPAGPVWDIGGGNGYVTMGLIRAGFEAVLLEPEIEGARNARKRGLRTIVCSTVEDAGFKSHAVAAVGLFDVLEHVEDDVGFLKRLRDLLAPAGRVYVTVPAYRTLWSVQDEYVGHFRRYTVRSLWRILDENGCTVEYATHFFSYLPIPLFFAKALPSKLGLARRKTPEGTRKEHTPKSRWVNRLLAGIHALELTVIRRGRRIPVGTSILVVAKVRK
jgi:SAM-dependent methyltransferase